MQGVSACGVWHSRQDRRGGGGPVERNEAGRLVKALGCAQSLCVRPARCACAAEAARVRCAAAAAAPRRRAQGGVPAAGWVMARRVEGILGDRDTGEQGGADCCKCAARPPQPPQTPALRAGRSQFSPGGWRAFLPHVCIVWRYSACEVSLRREISVAQRQTSQPLLALPAPRRRRATTAPHAGSLEHARRQCGTPEG